MCIHHNRALQFGEIIKSFLVDQSNRRKLNAFITFCLNHTIGYLEYLKAIGYTLPSEHKSNSQYLTDMAHDILCPLFRRDSSGKYTIIDDYFARKGVSDYSQHSSGELFTLFSILLRGFAKRELSVIRKNENPQAGKLKKGLKEILMPPEYSIFTQNGKSEKLIYKSEFKEDLRQEKISIPDIELYTLILDTFYVSSKRTTWCREMFLRLNTLPEFQNLIARYRILANAVKINVEYVELSYRQAGFAQPDQEHAKSEVLKAIESILNSLMNGRIAKYHSQGRINEYEAKGLINAARNYLIDISLGGFVEAYPAYFREQTSIDSGPDYQKKYKYLVDSVLGEALKKLKGKI